MWVHTGVQISGRYRDKVAQSAAKQQSSFEWQRLSVRFDHSQNSDENVNVNVDVDDDEEKPMSRQLTAIATSKSNKNNKINKLNCWKM